MSQVIGYICLGFLCLVIGFMWWCILGDHGMSEESLIYMEEQGKKQMRDAGWSEEDIEQVHRK